MGLPNFKRFMAQLPDGLHCSVLDSQGISHDGILPSVTSERGATEYGFPEFGEEDVFIKHPYSAPAARLQVSVNGKTYTRRILRIKDYQGKDGEGICQVTIGGAA